MEFEKLKGIIAEILNVDPDEITMDTTFVDDLGADSLDIFQIIMGIEEEFDIDISSENAEKLCLLQTQWKKSKKQSVKSGRFRIRNRRYMQADGYGNCQKITEETLQFSQVCAFAAQTV